MFHHDELPPLPTQPLTLQEALERYGLSKPSFYARAEAAGVTAVRRGKRVYYTPEAVWALDQCHKLLHDGHSLKEVKALVENFVQTTGVDEEVELPLPVKPEPPAQPEQGLSKLEPSEGQRALVAFTSVLDKALNQTQRATSDPLRPQRLLKEAADNEFTLTVSQLAEVVGCRASTLREWAKTPLTVKFGFVLTRETEQFWAVRKATTAELRKVPTTKRGNQFPVFRRVDQQADNLAA
jgi:DNA-binding transcriptional MerR regulator